MTTAHPGDSGDGFINQWREMQHKYVKREQRDEIKIMPAGWIEQPTSSLRVTRSTTELSGLFKVIYPCELCTIYSFLTNHGLRPATAQHSPIPSETPLP